MSRVKNAIPLDTVLNEFVYTAIFKADYEQKRGLRGKYQKAANSEKAARTFANRSTREEKEHMLAHLGYEFYYVMNKAGKTLKHVKEFLPILTSKKTSAANKALAEDGLLITSDRDTLRALGLISATTHHPSFFLDMEFTRQGYHISKWKKRYASAKDFEYREADESARLISKTLLDTFLIGRGAQFSLGCNSNQLCVLMYLYNITETTNENIKDYFAGRFTAFEFTYAVKGLMNDGLISKLAGKISITGPGIKKVNAFFNSVIHSNNF